MTAAAHSAIPEAITPEDVSAEVDRLFGGEGVVVRVLSDDASDSSRDEAFTELLESLRMYGYTQGVTVEAPGPQAIWKGLSVLAKQHLQRQLFEQILTTFGRQVVNPLVALLESPGEEVRARMDGLRATVLGGVSGLKISAETAAILRSDLEGLLTDEYLDMLAEHEETVQRPRADELAHEILHLIGATFQRAFRRWPDNARTIADSVARRMGPRVSLRTSPQQIRNRIVEGIEDFLWVETSTELDGALQQLLQRYEWTKLVNRPPPEFDRCVYREFSEACWELVATNA